MADEGAVDLDLVEGEGLERRERRVAGAEIVHGDGDAEALELPQNGQGAAHIVDDDRFRDLQFEPGRRQARLGQDGEDPLGEVRLLELERREVHGDLEGPVPGRGLAAGGAQDPFAERQDHPALLGEGDEGARRDEPAGRVDPAHQGLEPDELPAAGRHLRLVVEGQFVLRDGPAEVVLKVAALGGGLVHAGVVDAVAVPALLLRGVEGEVGMLERLFARRAVLRRQGDANAEADLDPLVAEGDRGVHGRDQALCQGFDRIGIASPGDEHGEFVAAEPRHRVLRAQLQADAVGDGAEHRVARQMAEPFVHGLESVEVEAEHGRRAAAQAQLGDPLLQPVVEQGAVRQVGQAIVPGHVGDLPFGGLAGADVDLGADEAQRPSVRPAGDHPPAGQQPHPGAVLAAHPVLALVERCAPLQMLVEDATGRRSILRWRSIRHVRAWASSSPGS